MSRRAAAGPGKASASLPEKWCTYNPKPRDKWKADKRKIMRIPTIQRLIMGVKK